MRQTSYIAAEKSSVQNEKTWLIPKENEVCRSFNTLHEYLNSMANHTDSDFTREQEKQLALVYGVTAAICLVACCITLLLIVVYQAFRTTLQRLFLYLTVSVTIKLVAFTLQLDRAVDDNDQFCAFMGFLDQYTFHVLLYFNVGITIYLLYHVRELNPNQHRSGHSIKHRVSLEVGFVLFSILFPLTYNWIPFVHDAYGGSPQNPFCWIRTGKSNSSDITTGLWYQLVLGDIPFVVIPLLIIVFICIIVGIYCRWACKYWKTEHVRVILTQEVGTTLLLLIYFVIFTICIIIVFTVATLYALSLNSGTLHSYGLWMALSIIEPLAFLSIPVSFIVYLYFRGKEIRRARRAWKDCWICCKTCKYSPMEEEVTEEESTFQESVRLNIPSTTWYSAPAEFSDECSNVSILGPVTDEKQYGSCTDTV